MTTSSSRSDTLLICLCPTLRMTHDHPTLIKEAPSELLEHERRHRHSITGSRIRMLRLLKRGEAKSVREAGGTHRLQLAAHPEMAPPPIRRASKLYSPRPSSAVASELMTPAAGDALNEAVKRAELKSHREARELLAEHGAAYADESGIHRLFKRHGIRSKAGRYQHEKSDPEVVEVFEKLRSAHSGEHPHGPGRPPGAGDGPG